MTPPRPQPTQGLILSGGGAFAAYEVGVMKALIEGASDATGKRPLDPRVVTGTSAGAFNATLLVDRWEMDPVQALEDIEHVWLEEVVERACGNGVFRWRGSPFNLFDVDCLVSRPRHYFWERVEDAAFFTQSFLRRGAQFVTSDAAVERRILELLNVSNLISTAPFPHLLRRTIDFEHVRRSDRLLRVVATNFRNGEVRVFDNRDMSPDSGPPIIMASSAIPGIFPSVEIPPDVYVDGGVIMNTPLSPAIHAGATELHVVYLDPDIGSIPLPEQETTLAVLQRTFAITMAAIFNRDIAAAERINRTLALIAGTLRPDQVSPRAARDLFEVVEILRRRAESARPFQPVVIHRYHPHDLLGDGLGILDFRRHHLEGLIRRGWEDAAEHDCHVCGCVGVEREGETDGRGDGGGDAGAYPSTSPL